MRTVPAFSRRMGAMPGSLSGGPMEGWGVNVGIPVPISYVPFSGHKDSFFGDLHVMGRDGVAFYTEAKCVTSRWFSEEDKQEKKISTWEGTITRK